MKNFVKSNMFFMALVLALSLTVLLYWGLMYLDAQEVKKLPEQGYETEEEVL